MTGKPRGEVLYPLAVLLGLVLVLSITWWVLWRKGHSYLWLLLCWNPVGPIAVFRLSNRRASLERLRAQKTDGGHGIDRASA